MTAIPPMPPAAQAETEAVWLLRQMVIAIDVTIRRRMDEGKKPLPGSTRYQALKKRVRARRRRELAAHPHTDEDFQR